MYTHCKHCSAVMSLSKNCRWLQFTLAGWFSGDPIIIIRKFGRQLLSCYYVVASDDSGARARTRPNSSVTITNQRTTVIIVTGHTRAATATRSVCRRRVSRSIPCSDRTGTGVFLSIVRVFLLRFLFAVCSDFADYFFKLLLMTLRRVGVTRTARGFPVYGQGCARTCAALNDRAPPLWFTLPWRRRRRPRRRRPRPRPRRRLPFKHDGLGYQT